MNLYRRVGLIALGAIVTAGVAAVDAAPPASEREDLPTLRYVGSSTIGNFVREAEPAYGDAKFVIDTGPESAGGEQAILEGTTDIAGVAARPRSETLAKGVVATLIGRDAIAVIVHPTNTIADLSLEQLRGIFDGEIANWKEVGGRDAPVHPVIVSLESATRRTFRSVVLREADYGNCEVARPDSEMIALVAKDRNAIGQISFSFLTGSTRVRPVSVQGQQPRVSNLDYPITRPLFLLWWPGRDTAADFATWVLSEPGQQVVMRRFVGIRSKENPDVGERP